MQSAIQTQTASKTKLWATHARIGDPLLSHVLFPVYAGVLVWGGLYLRNERLRTLLPLRS